MRAKSITSDTASYAEGLQLVPKVKIPAHFSLLPTVPNPFSGTLEASLDAILSWGSVHADTQAIVNVLLREVNRLTNWPELLSQIITDRNLPAGWGRYLVEELLFLVTRTLLPEQIAENRLAMGRLYERKKHLAIRLVLRYDMLREWKTDSSNHTIAVSSVPPGDFKAPPAPPSADAAICPNRRRLMPNVLSTLIAAPLGGFSTHGVRERMKHHVTDVDSYLLLSDDKVAAWNTGVLVEMTSQIILQWQWLRQNNETLQDMEVHGWEELDCKADECEWIADDVKKPSGGRKEKSGIAGAGTESTEAK
ncbi:hypothetical protein BKA66DRAFT_417024 [Pyrenochaeta sp. MPI-SDFR-AT-0127]|nr:hypothetical protein BKA66DRAFT_417024 [Pyrenochaeta sp. MPI-SDFR-AT-0127]